MTEDRSLLIDADLVLQTPSGIIISLRLESGQGVVDLNDSVFLRKLIMGYLSSRKNLSTLQYLLKLTQTLNPGIDITVAGKQIASIGSKPQGGWLCKLLGLTGLRVRPLALLRILIQ
ncbi:MAG: hypothetical protein QNJ78_12360 [Gammaproteobacteria bacterium]|nr:hypothetical protein [Gammaproteobacteria bacterium]